MKTADFIKKYCIGTTCPDFDGDGCRAYDGEECDEAFGHPRWRGLKMADRVTMLCEKRQKRHEKPQKQSATQGRGRKHKVRATSFAVPAGALDARRSPLSEETRTEYAVEAGGSVLSHKRFATWEDAYFYGCLLANARDRERCGRVMVKRRVVQRRVTFDRWMPSPVSAIKS